MTPRSQALQRTFVAALSALEDLGKQQPQEASEIWAALAAHLRSSRPLILQQALIVPAAVIERELADGSRYRLSAEDGAVTIRIAAEDDAKALSTLLPLELARLGHDIDCVGAALPEQATVAQGGG